MSKRLDSYLEKFFEEKELKKCIYEIEHEGDLYFIETKVVIGLIESAPYNEKHQIVKTLMKIDFLNGDVDDYLEFLAKAYLQNAS